MAKGEAAQSEGKGKAVGALVLTAFFVRWVAAFVWRWRLCFGVGIATWSEGR